MAFDAYKEMGLFFSLDNVGRKYLAENWKKRGIYDSMISTKTNIDDSTVETALDEARKRGLSGRDLEDVRVRAMSSAFKKASDGASFLSGYSQARAIDSGEAFRTSTGEIDEDAWTASRKLGYDRYSLPMSAKGAISEPDLADTSSRELWTRYNTELAQLRTTRKERESVAAAQAKLDERNAAAHEQFTSIYATMKQRIDEAVASGTSAFAIEGSADDYKKGLTRSNNSELSAYLREQGKDFDDYIESVFQSVLHPETAPIHGSEAIWERVRFPERETTPELGQQGTVANNEFAAASRPTVVTDPNQRPMLTMPSAGGPLIGPPSTAALSREDVPVANPTDAVSTQLPGLYESQRIAAQQNSQNIIRERGLLGYLQAASDTLRSTPSMVADEVRTEASTLVSPPKNPHATMESRRFGAYADETGLTAAVEAENKLKSLIDLDALEPEEFNWLYRDGYLTKQAGTLKKNAAGKIEYRKPTIVQQFQDAENISDETLALARDYDKHRAAYLRQEKEGGLAGAVRGAVGIGAGIGQGMMDATVLAADRIADDAIYGLYSYIYEQVNGKKPKSKDELAALFPAYESVRKTTGIGKLGKELAMPIDESGVNGTLFGVAQNVSRIFASQGIGGALGKAASSIPALQAIPTLAKAAGSVASKLPFLTSVYASAANEAAANGATQEQQATYGMLMAIIEGGTESAIFGRVTGMESLQLNIGRKVAESLMKQGANTAMKRLGTNAISMIVGALPEVIEEMTAEGLGVFAKRATYDPNASTSAKQILDAGAGGGVIGLVVMALGMAEGTRSRTMGDNILAAAESGQRPSAAQMAQTATTAAEEIREVPLTTADIEGMMEAVSDPQIYKELSGLHESAAVIEQFEAQQHQAEVVRDEVRQQRDDDPAFYANPESVNHLIQVSEKADELSDATATRKAAFAHEQTNLFDFIDNVSAEQQTKVAEVERAEYERLASESEEMFVQQVNAETANLEEGAVLPPQFDEQARARVVETLESVATDAESAAKTPKAQAKARAARRIATEYRAQYNQMQSVRETREQQQAREQRIAAAPAVTPATENATEFMAAFNLPQEQQQAVLAEMKAEPVRESVPLDSVTEGPGMTVRGQPGAWPVMYDESTMNVKPAPMLPEVEGRKRVTPREILANLSRAFSVPLRHGGLGVKNAAGVYLPKNDIILSRQHNDLQTGLHELGHAIDTRLGISERLITADMIARMPAQYISMYEGDAAKRKEAFSEWFKMYMVNRPMAEQFAGEAHDALVQAVTTAPALRPDQKDANKQKALARQQAVLQEAYFDINAFGTGTDYEKTSSSIRMNSDRPMTFGARIVEGAHKFVRAAFDEYEGLRRVVTATYKATGETIPAASNPYVLAQNARTTSAKASALVKGALIHPTRLEVLDRSFASILSELPEGTYNDFEAYLKSRHAMDWHEQGRRVVNDEIRASLERVVTDVESNRPELKQVADNLYAWWHKFTEAWLVDTGLLSKESYALMRKLNPHYIPLFRVTERGGNGAQKGFSGADAGIMHATKTGSTRDTKPAIVSFVNRIYRTVAAVQNTEVMRALDAAATNPETASAVANYMREVPEAEMRQRGFQFATKDKIQKAFDRYLELATAENVEGDIFEAFFEEIDNTWTTTAKAPSDVDNTIVSFMRANGTMAYYDVYDKGVLEALKGLAPKQANAVLAALGKVTSSVSYLITNNLLFSLGSNVWRDAQEAFVYGTSQDTVGQRGKNKTGYMQTLASAYTDLIGANAKGKKITPEYLFYVFGGGGGGMLDAVFDTKSAEAMLRDIVPGHATKMNKLADGIRTLLTAGPILEVVETSQRLAQFKRDVRSSGGIQKGTGEVINKAGVTIGTRIDPNALAQATRNAADVTVDFKQRGTLASSIGPLFLFYNATMQGAYKTYKFVADPTKHKQILPMLIKASIMGIALQAILDNLFGDDEEYKGLNGESRDKYFFVPNPTGIGERFIRLPKMQGPVAAFMGGIQDMASSTDNQEDAMRGNNILGTLKDEIAMPIAKELNPLSGGVWQGIWDISRNTTYYGAPIESAADQRLSPTQRYNENTSEVAKVVSGLFGVSPKMVDYFISQYFGNTGRFVQELTTASNYGDKSAGEMAFGLTVQPLINKLTANPQTYNNAVSLFYEGRDWLTFVVNDYESNGVAPTLESLNPRNGLSEQQIGEGYLGAKKLKTGYDAAAKEMTALNKEITAVNGDASLTDKEKKERVNGLRRQINIIAMDLRLQLAMFQEQFK